MRLPAHGFAGLSVAVLFGVRLPQACTPSAPICPTYVRLSAV
jgi:hypothetical protein